MSSDLDLTNLSERQFIERFLIPLFKAMKFQDVDHYHGGQTEQGKDIVMWKLDGFGVREDYAVVVKKGNITGKAKGKNSANEVCFQINQCLGTPFSDKITGEERRISQCLVVTTGTVSHHSRDTILGAIQPQQLTKYIKFYDGDQIKALLEQYCPEISAFEQILRSYAIWGSQVKEAEMSVKLTPNKQHFVFQPKPGMADSQAWSLKLKLDLAAMSKKERTQLKAFFEEGEGDKVAIPKLALKEIRFPEIFQIPPLSSNTISSFEMERIYTDLGIFTLRKTYDNQTESLDHIKLIVSQAGNSRLKLTNRDDTDACRILINLDLNTRAGSFSFTPLILGQNVWKAYRALAFGSALAKPGLVSVVNDQTGISILEGMPGELPSEIPITHTHVNILRKLATIQQKTATPLLIKREIVKTDLPLIEHVFTVVTEGRLPYRSKPIIVHLQENVDLDHYSRISQSTYIIKLSQPEYPVTLLDTTLNLGVVEIIAEKALFKITEEGGKKQGKLVPSEDKHFYLNFVKFSGKESVSSMVCNSKSVESSGVDL